MGTDKKTQVIIKTCDFCEEPPTCHISYYGESDGCTELCHSIVCDYHKVEFDEKYGGVDIVEEIA